MLKLFYAGFSIFSMVIAEVLKCAFCIYALCIAAIYVDISVVNLLKARKMLYLTILPFFAFQKV